MRDLLRDIRQYALPLCSGLLLALTTPIFELTQVVWIAFVPLFVYFEQNRNAKKQLVIGAIYTGTLYFAATLYPLFTLNAWWWIDIPVLFENREILWFWGIIILIFYGAFVQFGTLGLFYVVVRRWGLWSLSMLPLAWIGLEVFREYTVQGFTWGHVGYALHDHGNLLQLSSLGGVYLLSFLVLVVNSLLFLMFNVVRKKNCSRGRIKDMFQRIGPYLALLILVIVSTNALGWYVASSQNRIALGISVAVIQDGVTTPDATRTSARALLQGIETQFKKGVTLVVLPENSFPFLRYSQEENQLVFDSQTSQSIDADIFDNLLRITEEYKDSSLILGMDIAYGYRDFRSGILVITDGNIIDIYEKQKLLPFSERSLFDVAPSAAKADLLRVEELAIAPMICSEVNYTDIFEDSQVDLIIIVGNDGVFDSSLAAKMHHRMAQFRAAEKQTYVIRAMKTGTSSVIDPRGNVIQSINFHQAGVLDADI